MTVKKNSVDGFRKKFSLPDFNKKPFFNFIKKRSGPYDGSVTLTKDRVYIVPTKAGLVFSVLVLTMLLGSVNYERSLGYVLTFLLVGIGNISLLATWRNLAGLRLKRINSAAVFAGETILFNVQLENPQLIQRYSLAISYQGVEYEVVDCAANSSRLIQFQYDAVKRGLIKPGSFRLYTEFPTGLFIAWTWLDLNMSNIVYPCPDKDIISAFSQNVKEGEEDLPGYGVDNFSHLRKYQSGDNIKHISWKASAKNDELFTKEFNGARLETLWINWFEIKANNEEHRLSIMAAYIINAEKNNQVYGLKLPDKKILPASGNQHYHKCLTALALYSG